MADLKLVKTTLLAGTWHGELHNAGAETPNLQVTHDGDLLDGLEATSADDVWHITFPLPADRITDGVQTFIISDTASGRTLASFSVLAGEALSEDLRAEVDLLRAELDMLKKAFRRHCLETQ